ncbi:PriCT-2 domain-containing protein [Polynucleobacter sp. JS-Safj-400b-B2]|uniref:PriCT-2 domain-containing protein n=1 Tax=Polynucleobacter sp. JS-Safj-400b-B2 TaxID=2576921 RepID=UPI001C0D810B|nr:PriCT-2 domain-containing protein [Polynucleobacter sp. JS-Safj-400b-B2]
MVNATHTTWTSELDKARDALGFIDSDDRKEWLLVGAALKNAFGQEAFELWDSWSAKAESYNAATAKYTWKQLKLTNVGIGSLFNLAKQGGFDPSGRIGYETLSPPGKAGASAIAR